MTKPLSIPALAALLALSGCIAAPDYVPDRNPQVSHAAPKVVIQGECSLTQMKTYRPSLESRVKDYSATIPANSPAIASVAGVTLPRPLESQARGREYA